MLALQPSISDNHDCLDQKGKKNTTKVQKLLTVLRVSQAFLESGWKDKGFRAMVDCTLLYLVLQGLLPSGRQGVVAVGEVSHVKFRGQSFVSPGAFCLGSAQLSCLKGWKGYGYPLISPA